MRLFVAILLPEEWKQILAKPEASIGWLGRGVRWVEPRGMHLTLKFLGEIEDEELGEIVEGLRRCCEGTAPFAMRIHRTGVFPTSKRPRVYWAGIDAPAILTELQQRIESEMVDLGFPPEEKPFKPHLTLARIKDPIGKERMTDAILRYALDSDPVTISEIALMRSHLSGEGAHYEAIERFVLGNGRGAPA